MQRSNSPIIMIAILLGAIAIIGSAFLFLKGGGGGTPAQSQQVAAAPTPTPSPVLVAIRAIPPRTIVTTDMLRPSSLTTGAPADAVRNPEAIAGKITTEPIAEGQAISLASFTDQLKRAVPANIAIPSGYRAVAIWVDPTQTAAGLVDIGDRVDVIATHRLNIEKQKNQMVDGALAFTAGRLIAKDLLVLGVDRSINAPAPTPTPVPGAPAAPPAAPTAAPAPNAPGAVAPKTRVLLAAKVDVATRLAAAEDQGTLHIVIRNPNDVDETDAPLAREYPSRIINLPPDKSESGGGGNSGGGSNGGSRPVSAPPIFTGPEIRMPTPAPVPVSTLGPAIPFGTPAPPPAPTTKEITVVRGTEKTRVEVPIR